MKEDKIDLNVLDDEVQPLLAVDNVSCSINPDSVGERTNILDSITDRMLSHQIMDEKHILKFEYEESIARLLLDFIMMEQQCCSFFNFDLKFRVEQNYLEFDISSEKVEGTRLKELVTMMISN